MDSTDSGMVQIGINGLIITVDRETARMVQAGKFSFVWKITLMYISLSIIDPEACENYSRQIRQQLFGKEQNIDSDIPVPVWKTSKNQSERDREGTRFFLDLRKQYDKEFAGKTANKNSVWTQIAKIMNDNGFFVGDGIDGREKCRQKFSNLQASYIKCVDKRKQTGEGNIVKPPFYDELEDIMGDKHKIEPILVLYSRPIEIAEMEKVQEEKTNLKIDIQ
ncbi:hypothetical protein JTB14_012682 [Gonioctena quinquepunctata]|nr:hypothetical protein JTB14_012682 [Gonioctena quinquepunctata]